MWENADSRTGSTRASNSRVVNACYRHRHWLWLSTTLLTVAVASGYMWRQTPLYRSEGLIVRVAPQIPAAYVPQIDLQQLEVRIPAIRNEILSRKRLDRIISDLDLYASERVTLQGDEIVEHMRRNISVEPRPLSPTSQALAVGFVSADPLVAKQVAERLVALFIDEATRDRKLRLEGIDQFLDMSLKQAEAQLEKREEVRRIVRRAGTNPFSIADDIDMEIMKDMYKKLRTHKAETGILASMERREIGEQLKLLDPPVSPTRPLGRGAEVIIATAAAVGFLFGLTLFFVVSRIARGKRPTPQRAVRAVIA